MFHGNTDVSWPDKRLSGSEETVSIVETVNGMRTRNELIYFVAEFERDLAAVPSNQFISIIYK